MIPNGTDIARLHLARIFAEETLAVLEAIDAMFKLMAS